MTACDRFAAARDGGEEDEGARRAGLEGGGSSSSSIGSDAEIEFSPMDAVAGPTGALADENSELQP